MMNNASKSSVGWYRMTVMVLWIASWACAGSVIAQPRSDEELPDETQAIQRAVQRGGEIVLPARRVRLTRTVVIDLNRSGYTSLRGNGITQIVMAGPGPAFLVVGTHFESADPGRFEQAVWQRQRMPLIDGIGIEGAHPQASGIAARGTMQLTITRVHLRHLLHGIHLLENNRNLIIADCHIYDNAGVGVYYDQVNLHQSNITGCHISYNRGGGIVSRGGNVRNIHITGCDLESNMGPDTPPTANVLIDCRGSRYGTAEVAITGCTIQHNHTSPDSANIRILGRTEGPEPDAPNREGNVTITGNVLSDVQVNLHLRECRGVAVTGNTFWMGYRHNLLLEQCSNVVIGANNLDRNPRYAYGDALEATNSVVVRDCSDLTLNGLHVTNVWKSPAGVLIERSRRLNITNCTILDCDNCGLLLRDVSDSRVSDCLIRNDRPNQTAKSLVIEGGKNRLLADNLLEPPADGSEEEGATNE